MVLNKFSILVLAMLSFLLDEQGSLYLKYDKQIKKELNRHFDFDKSTFHFNTLEDLPNQVEIYSIHSDSEHVATLMIAEVRACDLTGCQSAQATDKLEGEYYDLMALINPQEEIVKLKVLNYFSDYGYEIASKRYLQKYEDFNVCDFSSESPKVDGVSGATISYNALLKSLQVFCEQINK